MLQKAIRCARVGAPTEDDRNRIQEKDLACRSATRNRCEAIKAARVKAWQIEIVNAVDCGRTSSVNCFWLVVTLLLIALSFRMFIVFFVVLLWPSLNNVSAFSCWPFLHVLASEKSSDPPRLTLRANIDRIVGIASILCKVRVACAASASSAAGTSMRAVLSAATLSMSSQ